MQSFLVSKSVTQPGESDKTMDLVSLGIDTTASWHQAFGHIVSTLGRTRKAYNYGGTF